MRPRKVGRLPLDGVRILAHRGASRAAPQNTLAAFALAADLGADGVELDVRLSSDGVPVVLHDPVLEGTTDLCGPVSSFSAAELARADAGWHFADESGTHSWRECGIGVPTLEEALDLCAERDLLVDVEIKNVPLDPLFDAASTLAVDVARRVVQRGEPDRVFLSSFNAGDMLAVRRAVPEVAVALLSVNWDPADALAVARDGTMAGWHPEAGDLLGCAAGPEAALDAARAASCWIAPWTVNDPVALARLAQLGVDAVITDVPDVARQAVK